MFILILRKDYWFLFNYYNKYLMYKKFYVWIVKWNMRGGRDGGKGEGDI